jgi:hypothetical protein
LRRQHRPHSLRPLAPRTDSRPGRPPLPSTEVDRGETESCGWQIPLVTIPASLEMDKQEVLIVTEVDPMKGF